MEPILDIPCNIGQKVQEGSEFRIFEQFLIEYQPVLVKVEKYLEKVIEETDYIYRDAYIPWKNALHELLEGAYYIAKKIPLPSREEFMDALFMFSFKSTVIFLRDICTICQLKLKREWEKEFQEKINLLLCSVSERDQNKSQVA